MNFASSMEIRMMKKGDKLQTCMLDLEVGDVLEVPYKLHSASVIRAVASQMKCDRGVVYEVNARGDKTAKVTRVS